MEPPLVIGSSPRLWGTRARVGGGPAQSRFIPTPVGNTVDIWIDGFEGTVHPHACGEHHTDTIKPRLKLRFIPTPVGNTAATSVKAPAVSVHPHACGEHSSSFILSKGMQNPPLVHSEKVDIRFSMTFKLI